MKSYWDFIEEMARNIGNYPYSRLNNDREFRLEKYKTDSNYPIYQYDTGDQNVNVTKHIDNNGTIHYSTNDHSSKEIIHYSNIETHKPTAKLPFRHQEQTMVERIKDNRLPKEYATNFIYNHFKSSNLPLRSSDTQYRTGHNMWRKLAHKALDDGYRVYYHDGSQLNKSNKVNVDKHLDSSFGVETRIRGNTLPPDYEQRHIILSKKEL
jgi:hypothetical protein